MKENESRERQCILNLVGKPEGKRTLRRHNHRYGDNIKEDLSNRMLVCWLICLVHERLSGWLVRS
jgi:hypothetical protein